MRRSPARSRARAATERRLTVIVFDLDDFKAVNDRVGHLAGDAVLAEAAERMLTVMREADVAVPRRRRRVRRRPAGGRRRGRPSCSRAGSRARSPPARSALAGTLQLSAGVAELKPGEGPTDLFQRADDALYRAKELGKARTVARRRRGRRLSACADETGLVREDDGLHAVAEAELREDARDVRLDR